MLLALVRLVYLGCHKFLTSEQTALCDAKIARLPCNFSSSSHIEVLVRLLTHRFVDSCVASFEYFLAKIRLWLWKRLRCDVGSAFFEIYRSGEYIYD